MLEKFKQLYLDKYNISLTNDEATKMATELITLMDLLLKPITKPKPNEISHSERSTDETL